MYEIEVYENGQEMCRCLSVKYLKAFIQEAGEGEYWIKFKGEYYSLEDFLIKFEGEDNGL